MAHYLPEGRKASWDTPAVYPVASVSGTLKFFPTEMSLKNSSIMAKNSRWNTFVVYAKSRKLLNKSFLPEGLLGFQTDLLDHQCNTKKPDDYIVTAPQCLLVLRRKEIDPASQQAYAEVTRNRISLGNKSYNFNQIFFARMNSWILPIYGI